MEAAKPRTPAALPIAAGWLLAVNVLQVAGVQAPLTILVALLLLALLPLSFRRGTGGSGKREPLNPVRLGVPLALWLFVGYVWVRLLLQPSVPGLQNVLVYTIFVATIAVTAAQTSAGTPRVWLPRLRTAAVLAAAVYAATAFAFGFDTDVVYNARSFAMVGLVGLCVAIPLSNMTRRGWWALVTLFGAIVVSLSRTATGAAWVLLMALAFRRSTRGGVVKALTMMIAMGAAGWWAVNNFEPLRQRFEANDAVTFGGITIGTTGRSELWAHTLESWRTAPWLGHGPGSAEELITAAFGAAIGHPHCEYLRVLHDYGWVGLAILLAGMVALGWRCFQQWRHADDPWDRAAHQAAVLSFVALAGMAVTSNITVFVFVMMPLGTLFGLSLGRSQSRRLTQRTVSQPPPMISTAPAMTKKSTSIAP